jgi:hypothetical protein
MRRLLLILPLLFSVGACARADDAGAPPSGQPSAAFTDRAATVAAAWRAGAGHDTWRTGFVPLQDLTVLAADPGFDDDTKQAFLNGWFRHRIDLPTRVPPAGTVRYPDGSQQVPLVSAAQAYADLDRGDPPPCPRGGQPAGASQPAPTGPDGVVAHDVAQPCVPLTVTRVELGTTTLRTSRGVATAPAWMLTVAELPEPIARVAVAPSAIKTAPDAVLDPPVATDGLVGAQDFTGVDGTRLTYRLGVGACDENVTPLVHETDDAVVLGGSVTRSAEMCTDQLLFTPVTVTLRAPLGTRAVLDALSGAGLVLTQT